MHKITVSLPENRDFAGQLSIEGPDGNLIVGPFPVCGRADGDRAKAYGNPKRNPLLGFGDMPLGEFQAVKIIESGLGTPYDSDEFGSVGIVLLEARRGDAALADANGRFGFFIQGGKLSKTGELRPTDGSLRLSNRDQRALVTFLRRFGNLPCHCTASGTEDLKGRVAVDTPAADSGKPGRPVEAARLEQPSAASELFDLSRRLWLRNFLLATGASVTISSALVFSLQSAFGREGEGDYSGPEPAPVPDPSVTPDPAFGDMSDLRDGLKDKSTGGNTTNLQTAGGTGIDDHNALAAPTNEKTSDLAQGNFDRAGSTGDGGNGAPVVVPQDGTGSGTVGVPQNGTNQQQGSPPNAATGTGATPESLARQQALIDGLKNGPPLKPTVASKYTKINDVPPPYIPPASKATTTQPPTTAPTKTVTLPGLDSPPTSSPPTQPPAAGNGGTKN